MPPQRGRACDACHTLKIKCELGSTKGGESPCQRCIRLEKICSVSLPVRKKDRIAELEAKLEEMTRLLRLQEIQEFSPNASTRGSETSIPELRVGNPKKRRLGAESTEPETKTTLEINMVEIDKLVPPAIQIQIFQMFRSEVESAFPFPITKSYDFLRKECPILLQAIIFAAGPGVLSNQVQDDLTSIVMTLFSPDAIAKSKKSIELLQAILVAAFWYRPPKNEIHIAIDRFTNMAARVAEEIGIANSDCALSVASGNTMPGISSSDAWRTWNLCYLLSAGLASCMRVNPRISWNFDLEMKLSSLEYGPDALSTDELLCQLVRSERLCEQITEQAGYNGTEPTLEITNYVKVRRIQNLINERKAQVFSSISCPTLKLYEHFATIYLHECILHTPTNKRSFAAPYVAERLSLTDFPAPLVTPEHITSLYTLRDACHAALNTIFTFDIKTIAVSPLIIYCAKAFYAQWLLAKLYIAVTATGNTYGAFIDVQSLELDSYLGRLADIGDAICEIDATYVAGKGLQSSKRLREWIRNYDALRAEESLTNFSSPPIHPQLSNGHFETAAIDWDFFDTDINESDQGFESLFGTFPN